MLTKAEREAIRQKAEGYQAWTQYRELLALLDDLDVKDEALAFYVNQNNWDFGHPTPIEADRGRRAAAARGDK